MSIRDDVSMKRVHPKISSPPSLSSRLLVCDSRHQPSAERNDAFDSSATDVKSVFALLSQKVTKALANPIQKGVFYIEKRSISGMIGKGNLYHNNRKFIAENVDKQKIKDNINIINENIKKVYHEMFDNALNEYNAKQKRKDRMIKDYYEHIRHSRQEKDFHEVIFQIGNMDDTPCGSDLAEKAAEALKRYAENFQKRNPHLRMFNAVIHLDEATPHIHIDFVPFATEQKRGLSTRVSLTKALEQQGFKSEGKFNTCSKLWIDSEKQVIADIMKDLGIEWEHKDIDRNHLSVKNFKLKKRQEEIEKAEASLNQKKQMIASANETLDAFDDKIHEKAQQISESETQLAEVKKKIDFAKDDLEKKQKKVHDILNFLPDIDREEKLEKDFSDISDELDEYLKNGFSIIRNKDAIANLIKKLYKIVKVAVSLVQKYSTTIFDLRENFSRCKNENDEFRQKNNDLYNRNRKLSKENQSLVKSNEFMFDVLSLVEHTQPELVNKAKTVVQDNKTQQEQTLVYQQQTKKMRSSEIE